MCAAAFKEKKYLSYQFGIQIELMERIWGFSASHLYIQHLGILAAALIWGDVKMCANKLGTCTQKVEKANFRTGRKPIEKDDLYG